MKEGGFQYWPPGLPKSLDYPQTPLFDIVETSARRFPDKAAMIYYGRRITYREFLKSTETIAYALHNLGVRKGDRVALFMQNTPHYVIGYFGALRANATVVPINPMLLEEELRYLLSDSGSKILITTGDLYHRVKKVRGETPLEAVIVGNYRDYVPDKPEIPVPGFLEENPGTFPDTLMWSDILSAVGSPPPVEVGPEDLAVLPYTSGSTGLPKGCMHTHSTVFANIVGSVYWTQLPTSAVHLSVLPLFHVTGMQHSMNAPFFVGATIVLFSRWDREAALEAIEKYHCTHWVNITTMLIDFLASPKLKQKDVSSLVFVGGGGAPMPEAISERLYEMMGLRFVEGYGLTETISQTHFNPVNRPKLQCLGIPVFDTRACVVDLETGQEVETGREGEIVVSGPQVFLGYWNRPRDTEEAFLTLNGQKYFKTGDIGRKDEEGYFFIVDRSKRMINAAGFKVWPTEIEGYLYKHPAIAEVCVVGIPDPQRVENVKAFVQLKPGEEGKVLEKDIIDWCRQRMAAYKYPRVVEFVSELPKSGTGKVLWRVLQEEERKKAGK